MLVMNSLHYDAMAVGNQNYTLAYRCSRKRAQEAQFPWLSANTYDKGKNATHYQPYIVKEIAGVRIGVLGLTTRGFQLGQSAEL